MFSGIALLDINMSRQSVYWLTGSFNYVYPMVMLLIYWYIINNFKKLKKSKFLLPLFAFLSSASVEQVAMMSIGLIVITIINIKFIKKEKVDKWFYISLAFSIFGAVSVLFAVSQFMRFGVENSKNIPLIEIIKVNSKDQLKSFLYGKYMFSYNVLTLLASGLCIYKLSSKINNKMSSILLKIFSTLSVLTILLMFLKQLNTQVPSSQIEPWTTYFVALYYFVSILITLILILKTKYFNNYIVPVIAIVLCFGSQLMMVVSPVYGARNVLCGLMMLTIYFTSLIPVCFNFSFGTKMSKYANVIVIAGYATLLVISIGFINKTIVGYRTNAIITKTNIAIAEQYKKNPTGTIKQLKLILEEYGWSMPYISKYHEVHYKMFLGVDKNTIIDWTKYQ